MESQNSVVNRGRILYITSRFPALSMTFVANEMTGIQDLGYDVFVGTLWKSIGEHKGHPAEEQFLKKIVSTHEFNIENLITTIKVLICNPKTILTWSRLIPGHLKSPWLLAKLFIALPKGLLLGHWAKDNNVQWIHSHFLTTPTTVALIASKVSGIPFSATAHAFDITSTNPKITNGSVEVKCKEAAAIITISEYNRTDILTRWPKLKDIRLEVIYNGISTSAFSPSSINEGSQDKSTTKKILSISNLNEKKGFHYLIQAASILQDRSIDFQLDLYGDGPERSNLEKQIKSLSVEGTVKIHGSINQKEVASLCSSTDIFVLASIPLASGDADGLPTVLIESLAAEAPTISTQVTGIPEIIIDGKTGLCVPPADAESLADAIQWMMENPDKSKAMAEAGRKLVLDTFDLRIATKKIDQLWQSLLSSDDS